MDKLMPGFDGEIAKLAQRVLVNPRHIDWHTGVLATKVTPGKPYAAWHPWALPASHLDVSVQTGIHASLCWSVEAT